MNDNGQNTEGENMKKIDDFFAAGVIIGSVSNILTNIDTLPLIYVFGSELRFPWNDLAALFFRPPEVYTFGAQFFGFLATFGVAITNGVLTGGLLKLTGRDFAYLKSIVVCSTSVMFALMVLFPSLGMRAEQHSVLNTYVALLNNQPFAILSAFLFLRFTTVGLKEPENEPAKRVHPKFRFVPVPARKLEEKVRKVRFVKPKKL